MTAVVLGCDIWCATVGEEHRLGCLRIRCCRGYFALKMSRRREEKKLHNGKLNDLYCSPGIIRVIKIKDAGTGEACRMYVGEEMCIEGSGKET